MSKNVVSKVKLKGFNDLFGGNSSSESTELKDAIEISLDEIHEFKNHPFIVRDDEKLLEMVESIKKVGILNPAIARKDPRGGYELISGHTRKEAAKRAGLTTMPVIVRDYDDDMATIAMVDSNLQREEISVREKARAYAMKYEALKHQDFDGNRRLDAMSEEMGESNKTVQRIITLNKLSDDLLDLIDKKRLGMRQGLDLTELDEKEQEMVLNEIKESGCKPSMQQSAAIKKLKQDGELEDYRVREILSSEKPVKKEKLQNHGKLSIIEKALQEMFSDAGILSYDEESERYRIKKDGEWIRSGLHCGECLMVFLDGLWVRTRIEMAWESDGNKWYLVGTKCKGNLENIIVKEV
ncbi:MAG: ParB/RepB/Spo0J family partition protein [Lachnospiraceae bacterium]|nr:ParB/RepB/Spo0J family partition protein [Lachnospiraceae bacterium]